MYFFFTIILKVVSISIRYDQKNKLRLWFQSINQSNKLNQFNETISSTRIPEEPDYSNYNGNTYFHLLSDEFYLICKNIPDRDSN